MNLKIKLAVCAAALLGIFAIATIFLVPVQQEPDPVHPPMRIGTLYWPGTFWVDIARAKGWFAEAGLDVEFVDTNEDYYGALDTLEAGDLDTLTVWLFDVVKRNQKGVELVMVLATDVSNGSEALVGAAHVKTVQDLKGARVGVPLESALVYELDVMLSRFGMSLNDVTLVDIEAERADKALSEAGVDAVMTWEPHVSDAVATGGHRLYDSSKLPGLIMGGMTFHDEFVRDRPEDIRRMLKVWHRTTDYIRAYPDEAFGIVAEMNNVTPEEAATFAEYNRIMDLHDNVLAFTYASGLESLFGSARKINRFLLGQGQTDTQLVEEANILDGQFVQELARDKADL